MSATEPDRKHEFLKALRREIAKDLLAGLLANPHSLSYPTGPHADALASLASTAVRATDALLHRLEQPETPHTSGEDCACGMCQ